MAGEHYAPRPRRPQAGVKIGFFAVVIVEQPAFNAKTAQKAVYVIDHLEIGFATGGIKSQQRCQYRLHLIIHRPVLRNWGPPAGRARA